MFYHLLVVKSILWGYRKIDFTDAFLSVKLTLTLLMICVKLEHNYIDEALRNRDHLDHFLPYHPFDGFR